MKKRLDNWLAIHFNKSNIKIDILYPISFLVLSSLGGMTDQATPSPPQEPTLGSFEKLLRISSKSPGEILRRNEVDSKRFGRESSVGEI